MSDLVSPSIPDPNPASSSPATSSPESSNPENSSPLSRHILWLYAVLAIPWVLALGYLAYEGHRAAVDAREDVVKLSLLMEKSARPAQAAQLAGEGGGQSLRRTDDVESRAIITQGFYNAAINRQADGAWRRNLALAALPIVPLGIPLLWLAYHRLGARRRLAS